MDNRNLLLNGGQRHSEWIRNGHTIEFICRKGYSIVSPSIRKCVDGNLTLPSCNSSGKSTVSVNQFKLASFFNLSRLIFFPFFLSLISLDCYFLSIQIIYLDHHKPTHDLWLFISYLKMFTVSHALTYLFLILSLFHTQSCFLYTSPISFYSIDLYIVFFSNQRSKSKLRLIKHIKVIIDVYGIQ